MAMPFSSALNLVQRELIPVGGFSLLINLLMLVSSIYMLQVFDRVLASGSLDTLLYLTLIAVVALAVYGVLEHSRRQILNRTGDWLERSLGPDIISASQKAALSGKQLGALGLRQLGEVKGFLTGEGMLALMDAPWTPIFIAVIWMMHPLLGAIALGGAVAMLACAGLNDVLTRPATRNAQSSLRECEQRAGEAICNAEASRALGMSEALVERWQASRAEGSQSLLLAGDRAAGMVGLSRFIRFALQIAILGAGAYLVVVDQLTAGGMIAGSILLGRALAPTEKAITVWRSLVSARAAQRGLKELVDDVSPRSLSTSTPFTLPRPTGRLIVRELAYKPPGSSDFMLRRASFALAAGEACAVIGPSGAGKSTLARLLTGVWTPLRGEVRLDGAELSHWEDDALGIHLGYLPQDIELFSGTVAQNIARMREAPIEDVIEAASLAGTHDVILALPQGYQTQIGEGGRRLSSGQRQRIGLARALFYDPVMIVLDEPNANLDGEGEMALAKAVHDLKARGRTVVLITHRPSLLGTVDKLLMLRAGVGELFGPRDEVLTTLKAQKVVSLEQAQAARGSNSHLQEGETR